jgi:uncharacterized protein with HEPN domain
MKRDSRDYLDDILIHARKASEFIAGVSREAFATDDKTRFAVIRALEVIGEAARSVPPDVCQRFPQIPWRRMVGMRNVLLHNYMGVDHQVVYDTATVFIPALIAELPAVIAALEWPDNRGA